MTTERDAQRRPSSGRRFGVQVHALSSAAIAASRSRRASTAACSLALRPAAVSRLPIALLTNSSWVLRACRAQSVGSTGNFRPARVVFYPPISRTRCAAVTFRIVYLVTRENVITAAATD
jgi:hypothetical protein